MISVYISLVLIGAATAAIAVHLWWEHRFEDAVNERLTRTRRHFPNPQRQKEHP